MVIRRAGAVVVAAFALVLAAAGPARADNDLTVNVAAQTPGQVRLDAFVGVGGTPAVTVFHEGRVLPSTVEVVKAPAAPADARAVVVVIDPGGSLTGAALRTAADAVLGFAAALPADVEVGIVAAADPPSVLVRPTRDRDALRGALSSLRAAGRPALDRALATAADLVAGYPDRRLLLVFDEQDAANPAGGAPPAAGTRVDLVAMRPIADGSGRLRPVVTATGGAVFPAATTDALVGALRSAAATVRLRLAITVAVPATLAGAAPALSVTVTSGATVLRAEIPVRSTTPTRAATSAAATAAAGPGMSRLLRQWLVGLLVFAALLASILLATAPLGRPVRQRRLRQVQQFRLAGGAALRAGPAAVPPGEDAAVRTAVAPPERVVTLHGVEGRIAARLEQAGIDMRPHEWAVVRVCATAVGGLLLSVVGGLPGFVLGAALGWLAPGLYRRLRESRRKRAFAEQLPDALQLVVGSLKSGFSLLQAVDAVSRELPPGPLATAFGRVIAETRIGADMGDALERAAERSDNDDLAWAVMAVRIQRETGGNLAEILQTTVDTLRERERLRGHVRALSAEGRLSAYILVALPIVTGGWMFLTRREYVRVLWTTPTGLAMLIGALVLVVIGSLWMSRWVKVEV